MKDGVVDQLIETYAEQAKKDNKFTVGHQPSFAEAMNAMAPLVDFEEAREDTFYSILQMINNSVSPKTGTLYRHTIFWLEGCAHLAVLICRHLMEKFEGNLSFKKC